MNQIQLVLDGRDPKQVRAALAFFNSLNEGLQEEQNSQTLTEVKPEKSSPKKSKADLPSSGPAVKPEETPEKSTAPSPAKLPKQEPLPEPEQEQEQEAEPTSITLNDVRALVAEKQKLHREAIKAKLVELDIPNTRSLKEDQFVDFMDFLNGLK